MGGIGPPPGIGGPPGGGFAEVSRTFTVVATFDGIGEARVAFTAY